MNAFTRTEQAALFHLRKASTHRRSICANYAQYEHRKAQWIAGNPGASHVEYDRAMQRIARECGV
jgi:hypothetical protein